MDAFVKAAADMAMRAAADYLHLNNLAASVNVSALIIALRKHVKDRMFAALDDTKAAFECNMRQAAEATFAASMKLAGIEAAKEATGAAA